jgi:hypothetical protein
MTQQDIVLDLLLRNDVVPSNKFVESGIYRYGARIFELREKGYEEDK